MKIAIVGKNSDVLPSLLKNDAQFVMSAPEKADAIIVYGGDGSLLGAEREYPGIPKLPVRDIETATHCAMHSVEKIISDFRNGTLRTFTLPKLTAFVNGVQGPVKAINDIFIHNRMCASAIRYKVRIDGELYAEEIVGDGAGVSTVHGSSAYYRSITRSVFRTGIGLAFSNSTEIVNHMVLPETSEIFFKITRGPAEVVFDNAPESMDIDMDGECLIRLSGEKAEVIGLDTFMCPECRRLRHLRRKDFLSERG